MQSLIYSILIFSNATWKVSNSAPTNDIDVVNMPQEPSLFSHIKPHLQMPDPWNISDIKPTIVFYKNGLKNYEVNYTDNPKEVAIKLNSSGFLDTDRLILITHGFHNNFDTNWLHNYKTVFLKGGSNKTVAILGWGGGADILVFRYRQAAANVMPVGIWFSNYVKAIKDMVPEVPIYGIGHSLGAHVMGIAGRTSKSFSRITGLDPAGPCFEKVENSNTLIRTDAPFVDVIHTDGYDSKLDPSEWFFPVNHYGSLVPIGTIDFYPNFGYHQPGAGTFTVAGSHLRAIDLFQWSITNPDKFLTTKVLDGVPDFEDPVTSFKATPYKAEMGFWADRWLVPPSNFSTLYYLKTNKDVPWD